MRKCKCGCGKDARIGGEFFHPQSCRYRWKNNLVKQGKLKPDYYEICIICGKEYPVWKFKTKTLTCSPKCGKRYKANEDHKLRDREAETGYDPFIMEPERKRPKHLLKYCKQSENRFGFECAVYSDCYGHTTTRDDDGNLNCYVVPVLESLIKAMDIEKHAIY